MSISIKIKKIEPSFPCTKSITFRLNPTTPTINKQFISEIYYNRKLEEEMASVDPESYVDLSYWNLIDHDISLITKQIIINKQCTELSLCGNKITSSGVSMLALKLSKNLLLQYLDLSHNRITDAGVHSLSQALLPNHYSSLKILLLNKNGISNDGIQYLTEMLKKNQTLTELGLANNEIGNEGVKQLAYVLIYHNKTLKILALSFNVFITDVSVDYLRRILEHNQTLKHLSINDCNLSETGKIKLREKAIRKKNFELQY